MSIASRDLPAEAGEFSGDRDGDDAVGLVAGVAELPPARVQAPLRAPGDVDHGGVLVALAALQRDPDPGVALVVVRGLDQQPPGMRRAGLGDRALAEALAAGFLLGDDPHVLLYLVSVLDSEAFRSGRVHTGLLDAHPYAAPTIEVLEAGTQTTVQDHPAQAT